MSTLAAVKGVMRLLARETDVRLDCKDDSGNTPLQLAAVRDHLPAVKPSYLQVQTSVSICI